MRANAKSLIRFDSVFPELKEAGEAKVSSPAVEMFKMAKLFIQMLDPR